LNSKLLLLLLFFKYDGIMKVHVNIHAINKAPCPKHAWKALFASSLYHILIAY